MQQYTLKIDGMMCGMCESHVNESIRNAFSVKKVTSSQAKGETIILTEKDLDEKKLKETIDKTGYQLLSISKSPYEKKKGLFSFLKKYALFSIIINNPIKRPCLRSYKREKQGLPILNSIIHL